jgi:hypothetical protein
MPALPKGCRRFETPLADLGLQRGDAARMDDRYRTVTEMPERYRP